MTAPAPARGSYASEFDALDRSLLELADGIGALRSRLVGLAATVAGLKVALRPESVSPAPPAPAPAPGERSLYLVRSTP
jgi:hypothetical protein